MEIPTCKKKKKYKIGIFFFKIGKKAPKFRGEWGGISAPENKKKIPDPTITFNMYLVNSRSDKTPCIKIDKPLVVCRFW